MTRIILSGEIEKDSAFQKIESYITGLNIRIKSKDGNRPWGGFFHIDERDIEKFIQAFFSDIPDYTIHLTEKLSPKILLVEKGKRLSWQFHHRRAEIWRVLGSPVMVEVSDTDEETEPVKKDFKEVIILRQGQRHRLIGADGWGVIAEIWQHTQTTPSDEDDIVRIQDDFGR